MNTVFGMLRVKNESMWVRQVVEKMLPLCERIFLFDDHSTDGTPELCRDYSQKISVYRSQFEGLDESRDKNFLLNRIHDFISEDHLKGSVHSPYWVLALDGDEVLEDNGPQIIRDTIENTTKNCFSLQVMYLWDGPTKVRVDGVYANFCRPSLFRLFNRNFRFMSTPWGNGANFHCASVPQELIHGFEKCPARIWHYGYMSSDHRKIKYEWYNKIDPNNENEDCYRHIIQGDFVDGPKWHDKLKYAGPMRFKSVEELCA